MTHYLPWPVQARQIKERNAQPLTIDGARFICSREATRVCGCHISCLHALARQLPGPGLHRLPNGLVFYRKERCRDDQRPLLYWREDTLHDL